MTNDVRNAGKKPTAKPAATAAKPTEKKPEAKPAEQQPPTQAAQPSEPQKTSLADQAKRQNKNQFIDRIGKYKKQLEAVIPRHLNSDALLRGAVRAIQENDDLLACDHVSLLSALNKSMQLGLSPSAEMGQAYLIPFKKKVQLIVGYRGYIALADNNEKIKTWYPQVVYENDLFDVEYGTEERFIHKPRYDGDRGRPVAFYSFVRRTTDVCEWRVFNVSDVERARSFSSFPNSTPWQHHYNAMALKSVMREHAKFLPLSNEAKSAIYQDDKGIVGNEEVIDITDLAEEID